MAGVFSEDDLNKFASDLTAAASAGEHAPEQLGAVMRECAKRPRVFSEPGAMAEVCRLR